MDGIEPTVVYSLTLLFVLEAVTRISYRIPDWQLCRALRLRVCQTSAPTAKTLRMIAFSFPSYSFFCFGSSSRPSFSTYMRAASELVAEDLA